MDDSCASASLSDCNLEVGLCENSGGNDSESLVPRVGMCFSSEDDLLKFYKSFAQREGFAITKASVKNIDGERRYFSLACSRKGKHVSAGKSAFNLRPSQKTGCQAKINVVVKPPSIYYISNVFSEHNHQLSPEKTRHFSTSTKRTLDVNDQAGKKLSKSSGEEVIDCVSSDISKSSKLRIDVGDAQAMCAHFVRMHKRNPNFYHVVDYDGDCRIRNVFWADARSRAAYQSFSDVVLFDTTYLTNKYVMPLASFIGVNHHGQSILLGCGLLSNEDTNSYIWLFKALLDSMSGVVPKAIVTDQCKAIQAAVFEVFPGARHRLCLWHIMRKVPGELSSFKQYMEIKKCLESIVYESITIDEFEERWGRMVNDFQLEENGWLSILYGDRGRWVPVFVKGTFWAGMSTMQSCEKMNTFFDNYVNSKTTLKQFVDQYDNVLKRKVENENKADFASFNTTIPLITDFCFEKQFQQAYTNDIFRKFQEEIKGMMFCNVMHVGSDGMVQTFHVSDIVKRKDGSSKKVVYSVVYSEEDGGVSCVCHLFDFIGIMCRHSIKVLVEINVSEVPSRFILDRWRKDIKRSLNFVNNCYDDSLNKDEHMRYEILYSSFCSIAEDAVKSSEKFEFAKKSLEVLRDQVIANDSVGDSTIDAVDDCSVGIARSSLKVRPRGRPPSKREESKIY